MGIREFAVSEWQAGNTDTAEAARKFLAAALTADDPERELYPLVYDEMSDQYKRLRRALRTDGPPAATVQTSGGSAQSANESHEADGTPPGTRSGFSAAQLACDSQSGNGGGKLDRVPGAEYRLLTTEQKLARLVAQDAEVQVPPEEGAGRSWVAKTWRQVTFDDCERVLRFYAAQARGIKVHSRYFSTAKTMIARYSVPELGDVPFDRIGRRQPSRLQST